MKQLKQLHNEDLNLWLEQIATKIKNQDFSNMDAVHFCEQNASKAYLIKLTGLCYTNQREKSYPLEKSIERTS